MGAVFVFGFVLHRPTAALQAQADGIAAVCAFFSLPLLLIWCHFRGKPKTTDSLRSQMFCAATYCVALLLLRFPLALIDRDVSSRYLATVVSERKIVPIGQIRSYHLQRARNYQISFYFHQELKEFDLAENNVRGVITSLSGAAELIRSGVRLGRHIYGGGLKNEASFDEILPSNSTDGPAGGGQVRQEK
jgi:hypothetical protein